MSFLFIRFNIDANATKYSVKKQNYVYKYDFLTNGGIEEPGLTLFFFFFFLKIPVSSQEYIIFCVIVNICSGTFLMNWIRFRLIFTVCLTLWFFFSLTIYRWRGLIQETLFNPAAHCLRLSQVRKYGHWHELVSLKQFQFLCLT